MQITPRPGRKLRTRRMKPAISAPVGTIAHAKEWRQREADAGRPSSYADYRKLFPR